VSWPLTTLLACLALAGGLSLRGRHAARPVARCLLALFALSLARLATLPPAAAALLWLLWPAAPASLAAHAWRRAWAPPAVAAGLYAAAALVLPPAGYWPDHAWLWDKVRFFPHAVGVGWALGAWGTRARRGGLAGAVAAVLGLSGFVDVTAGALALDPYHEEAASAVALVTWAAVANVLTIAWYREACPPTRTPG